MKVGDEASVTRRFGEEDVRDFALLAGLDDRAAALADTVPEPLVNALFSYLLGVKLPGAGTNYLKQETRFLAPAPLGEDLTARVIVARLRPEKMLADLETTCTRADGTIVAAGRALVHVRDSQSAP